MAKKVCIGDLNRKVVFWNTKLKGTANQTPVLSQDLINKVQKRAKVKTASDGTTVFDGVNTFTAATHIFTTRFAVSLKTKNIIEYDERYFGILDVKDPDEEKEWLIFTCNEHGDKTKNANIHR
jgi:head-tail adaptor